VSVAALHRRRLWTPGPGARIDTSHPLAAGLEVFVACPDGRFRDFVGGGQGTHTDTVEVPGAHGTATRTLLTGQPLVTVPCLARYQTTITTQHTVMACGVVPSNSGSYGALGGFRRLSSWSPPYFSVGCLRTRQNNDGKIELGWATGSTSFTEIEWANAISYGKPQTWIGAIDTAAFTAEMWVDGAKLAGGNAVAGSLNSPPSNMAGEPTLRIFNFPGGSAETLWGSTVSVYALWSRALKDADAKRLTADPFCMLTRGH
jgi:hypothetical protein